MIPKFSAKGTWGGLNKDKGYLKLSGSLCRDCARLPRGRGSRSSVCSALQLADKVDEAQRPATGVFQRVRLAGAGDGHVSGRHRYFLAV